MKRMEVILSQAIDEDFMVLCEERNVAKNFTKIPAVLGKGNTSPKMGDSVWPQFNTLYIIYCKKKEIDAIEDIVKTLQKEHPDEGIASFVSSM